MAWPIKQLQVKNISRILMLVALVVLVSSGLSPIYSADCQEIAASPENVAKTADQLKSEKAAAAAQCEPGTNWFKIIIIVGVILLAVFIFLCTASLHPYFQSKGDPHALVTKMGCEGQPSAGKKVLIAYHTRKGSTTSIALKIREVLCNNGFQVDTRPITTISENDDLSQYDAYVVGSGVIWSKLMPEFDAFIEKYKHLWTQKPHALFMACLTIQRDTEANWARVDSYIDASISAVPEFIPIERMGFAGAVDMKKLSFWESFALNVFFMVTPQRGGDHRDMNKVAAWAEKLSESLKAKLAD